jgi:hypothetical protein
MLAGTGTSSTSLDLLSATITECILIMPVSGILQTDVYALHLFTDHAFEKKEEEGRR